MIGAVVADVLHLYDVPPEAVSVTLLPAHVVDRPEIAAGIPSTVTVTVYPWLLHVLDGII